MGAGDGPTLGLLEAGTLGLAVVVGAAVQVGWGGVTAAVTADGVSVGGGEGAGGRASGLAEMLV